MLTASEILSGGSSDAGGGSAGSAVPPMGLAGGEPHGGSGKRLSRVNSFGSFQGISIAFGRKPGPPSLRSGGRRNSNSLLEAELEEARQEIERLQAINQRLQEQVDDLTLFNSSLLKDVSEAEKKAQEVNVANLPAAERAAATAAATGLRAQDMNDRYDKLAQQLVQERLSHKAELSETKQALAMMKMGAARNAQIEQEAKGCACTIS